MTKTSIYHLYLLECQTYYTTTNVYAHCLTIACHRTERTELSTFSKDLDLPLKIGELFSQMYVMICSEIIKCAVEAVGLTNGAASGGAIEHWISQTKISMVSTGTYA